MGSFRNHEVTLAEHRVPWQASSAGLGAGYVAWTITDAFTYYTLLGFSPICDIGPGLTHKVSRGPWHLVALANEGIHLVRSNKGFFYLFLLCFVLLFAWQLFDTEAAVGGMAKMNTFSERTFGYAFSHYATS